VHECKETLGVVLDLHINIELDVAVFGLCGEYCQRRGREARRLANHLHEQYHRLGERWDGLFRLLDRPNVLHAVRPIPVKLTNDACGRQQCGEFHVRVSTHLSHPSSSQALRRRRQREAACAKALRTGVMEHDNNVVARNVDVWSEGYALREQNRHYEERVPLSIPSAPSRMAASKLARVFSGNAADAYTKMRRYAGRVVTQMTCPAMSPAVYGATCQLIMRGGMSRLLPGKALIDTEDIETPGS
jgi:hypothetical protein